MMFLVSVLSRVSLLRSRPCFFGFVDDFLGELVFGCVFHGVILLYFWEGLHRFSDSPGLIDCWIHLRWLIRGYVGLGLATPSRRKPGQMLTKEQERNNRVLNRLRSVVERVIALVLYVADSSYGV